MPLAERWSLRTGGRHEKLRAQAELFGSVPSDSTLYRTFRNGLDGSTLHGLWEAMAEVRVGVWRRSSATTGTSTVVDIDSSLHQVHSENKEETAANYKGRFGFHRVS